MRNTVYVRKDVRFNEQVVNPPKSLIIYDNFFQDKNMGNTTQLFPLLLSKTEQLTRFTLTDENLTFHPTSPISPTNPIPIQESSISSTMLHLPAIFLGTPNTETPLSVLIQATPTSETPVLVPVSHQNQVPSMFENSKSDLSDAPLSNREEQNAPRRSAHTRANQVNYKKYFQKSKAATAKTNLSVPISSPHSELSCILFDYALNQHEKQATCGFIQIAQKKAKESTPDILSLRDAFQSAKANT